MENRLWRMIAPLRHRGPDDEGIWTDGRVGLAHARLSIIDLSAAGHQPMASPDGAVWLTYNGEIYNFADIRGELVGARLRLSQPHRRRGHRQWLARLGAARFRPAARHVRAWRLWDRRTRQLILARDRVGKKPLY